MKKTFITRIPDKPGSFLKPVKIISNLGLNITRVSYNNSIDTNILFIEVEGNKELIDEAYEMLKNDNFLFKEDKSNVILMEFKLLDKPNSLLPILEIINEFDFNNIDFSNFAFITNESSYMVFRIKEKKVINISLKVYSDELDKPFGLSNLELEAFLGGYVKRS